MSDYKAEAMELAEEQADEQFGTDFYSLTQAQQDRIYGDAEQAWLDKQYARAESMEDR